MPSTPGGPLSTYLLQAYAESKEALYSRIVFRTIAEMAKVSVTRELRVLDLGCADGRARKLLSAHWPSETKYFGVDCEERFAPDLTADIRDLEFIFENLPFQPNVILLTDVLEHLQNGKEDILLFLQKLKRLASEDAVIYMTAPQIYRLDCLKLAHLHYPEHKVRFTSLEWAALISRHLEIKTAKSAGFITALPYWLMFPKAYREENWLGRLFVRLRKRIARSRRLESWEHSLITRFGTNPLLLPWSNGVIFECKP